MARSTNVGTSHDEKRQGVHGVRLATRPTLVPCPGDPRKRCRHPAIFPAPVSGASTVLTTSGPRGVRMGRRGCGSTGVGDAVHTASFRALVGTRGRHPGRRRSAIRRNVGDDARTCLPPLARLECGEREDTARRFCGGARGGGHRLGVEQASCQAFALTATRDKSPGLPGLSCECARQDSNLRPLPPQGSALSPELRARGGEV